MAAIEIVSKAFPIHLNELNKSLGKDRKVTKAEARIKPTI